MSFAKAYKTKNGFFLIKEECYLNSPNVHKFKIPYSETFKYLFIQINRKEKIFNKYREHNLYEENDSEFRIAKGCFSTSVIPSPNRKIWLYA